jgi:hypothetical protein
MIAVQNEPRAKNVTVISRPFVRVVSGLPRSGMAFMMRMLEIGGLPVLFDDKRQADIDNPFGYAVKKHSLLCSGFFRVCRGQKPYA